MKYQRLVQLGSLSLLCATGYMAAAADLTWNGVAGDLLWSTPDNWDLLAAPTEIDNAIFDNTPTGSTNLVGAVNSIVTADTVINNLIYTAFTDSTTINFHTLLINPGITLSAHTDTTPNDDDIVGALPPTATAADQIGYWTILGTGGATLTAGNMENPVADNGSGGPGTFFDVWYRGALGNTGNSMTLDMSGLDNFNYGGGVIRVGSHATGASSTSRGILLLARTNMIICATPQIGTVGGIMVGVHTGYSGQTADDGLLQLGVTNFIRLDYLKIGAYRGSTGTVNFQPAVLDSNPTLLLRGIDGVSRVETIGIGDSIECTTDGNSAASRSATGTLDLTGGTVDALVNNLIVGRNMGSGNTSRRGDGTGTLTFTAGTIDATTLNIGLQEVNNRGSATGTVNVQSNAVLLVADMTIGGDAGGADGTSSGTLNITDGGQVTVANSIMENNADGFDAASSINLDNGTLTVGGTLTVDTLNVDSGTVANTGMATVGTLVGNGAVLGPVTVLTSLAPGLPIGTLSISNSLVLDSGSSSTFEVDLDSLSGDQVVGLTSVTYDGTLTVLNVGGIGAATNGAVVKLFDAAACDGSFTETSLPVLPVGLAWDTSGLANGTIQIVQSSINTTPTNLTYSITGDQLDISWPADQIGWRLEGQTNSIDVGMSSNWFTVPDSATTNRVILTVDPANGAVFYRLVYP